MRIPSLNREDVVSSRYQLTTLAVTLAEANFEVMVVAATSGYYDGTRRFQHEIWNGIKVGITASLGSRSRGDRAIGFRRFLVHTGPCRIT